MIVMDNYENVRDNYRIQLFLPELQQRKENPEDGRDFAEQFSLSIQILHVSFRLKRI